MDVPLNPQPKRKTRSADAFPFKSVAEELTYLQKLFRELVLNHAAQVEAEIAAVQAALAGGGQSRKSLPISRAHDLRDMLILLRNLEVKPAKGRRRDLKKIEVLVEELRRIVDRWD